MARSQIENRNFLAPTGFQFNLKRSPKVAFFCNEANIPDLNLGVAIQANYLRDIPTPGDKIEFGDLSLRFLVDEDLSNYMEIQNWIRGLGYPEEVQEFRDLFPTSCCRFDVSSREHTQKIDKTYIPGRNLTNSQLHRIPTTLVPKFQVNNGLKIYFQQSLTDTYF